MTDLNMLLSCFREKMSEQQRNFNGHCISLPLSLSLFFRTSCSDRISFLWRPPGEGQCALESNYREFNGLEVWLTEN